MSKTNYLIEVIEAILKEYVDDVSYDEGVRGGPDAKKTIHIIYELPLIGMPHCKSLYPLEVNVIGYGSIKSTIESLCDDIENRLDRLYHIDDNIQFVSYFNIKSTVKEDDKKIIRRRLTFEIHLHEKGEIE